MKKPGFHLLSLICGLFCCLLLSLRLNIFQPYIRTLLDLRFHKVEKGQLKIKRLAIIRPFGKEDSKHLHRMFAEWYTYLPCRVDSLENIHVDVFLSYSQTYSKFDMANETTNQIINEFMKHKQFGGHQNWQTCIRNVKRIEMNIDPRDDIYRPEESQSNRMWVHGPNTQFIKGLKTIMKIGVYDAAFVMEPDVLPIKDFWLETFIAEAESEDFAILGR